MTRAQAVLLRTFALWTIFVWVTRIKNIVANDENSVGFKVVHSIIAVISVALAIAALLVVRRVRSTTLAAGEASS